MKPIDLLTSGKQIRAIPKSKIPPLLGEIETLKARLWVRLIEPEERDSVIVLAKSASEQAPIEKPAKEISQHNFVGPEGRILRLKDVVRFVGLSRATIWKMHKEGRFPRSRHIGPRSVGWLDTEIHGWINERFGNGKG